MALIRTALALAALALTAGAGAAGAQQPAQSRTPPRMPHLAAGKEECLTCHGPGANEHIRSAPPNHEYGSGACPMCHRPSEAAPPGIPHALGDAFANCLVCHVANSPLGAPAPPTSHDNFHSSICLLCHQAAAPPPREDR